MASPQPPEQAPSSSSPVPVVQPSLLPSPLPNITPPLASEPLHPLSDSRPHSPTQSISPPSYPQPADFQPLFTLIHSSPSVCLPPQVHHPTIHYLFSSDPASDILSSALLSTLPNQSSSSSSNPGANQANHNIIVDLTPSGEAVAKVSSLSDEWQISGAEVVRAPTWDGVVGDGEREGAGLMLKIEGMGVDGWSGIEAEHEGREDLGDEEMEELLRKLEDGLEGLKRVVDLNTPGGAAIGIPSSREEHEGIGEG